MERRLPFCLARGAGALKRGRVVAPALTAAAAPERLRGMEGLFPGQRLARGVGRHLRGLDFATLLEFVPAPGAARRRRRARAARRDLDRRVQVEPGRLRLGPEVARLSRLVRPLLLGGRRGLPDRHPARRRRADRRRRLRRRGPALARGGAAARGAAQGAHPALRPRRRRPPRRARRPRGAAHGVGLTRVNLIRPHHGRLHIQRIIAAYRAS